MSYVRISFMIARSVRWDLQSESVTVRSLELRPGEYPSKSTQYIDCWRSGFDEYNK